VDLRGEPVATLRAGLNDDTMIHAAAGGVAPGRTVGPYRVVREIGRGGMGAVFLCEDTAVGDRPVALKVVLDPQQGGHEALERFQREIRRLGVLRHRNIVQVLFAGEHEGRPYFVMEYVPGRDLNRWFEETAALPEPERLELAAKLLARVADGVAFAHQNGTVHRDLKPQNVLVREDGEPAVLDFGVARHREDVSLTSGAAAPGTPSFMAPEQFEPGHEGPPEAVDVWALGSIAYLAFTREKPFKGRSVAALSYQVVNTDPIAPRKLNPAIPPALEAVVLRALEKDPHRRFRSAAEFRDALLAATGDGAHARTVRRAASAAGFVVLAALLGLLLWRPWEAAPVVDAYATLLRAERTDVAFDARRLTLSTFDPVCILALDGSLRGAIVEAALAADDGAILSRVPVNPAGPAFEAAFRVPDERRREGLELTVKVFAGGVAVPVRPAALRFVLDATPPRLAADVVDGGRARPWGVEPDAPPPIVRPGAYVEVRAHDPGGAVVSEFSVDGVRRAAPDLAAGPLRIDFDAVGERTATLRVRDAAGNEEARTFRVRVVATESRAASEPASRAAPRRTVADLPAAVGALEQVGRATDFARPAPLEAKDGVRVVVRNLLGPFELDWRLRVRDAADAVVGECVLEPKGLLGARSFVTVAGTLNLALARPAPGPLAAEFVLRDATGAEAVRKLDARFEWRAAEPPAAKPRVRFATTAGAFVVEVDRAAAPENATAFLAAVEAGFFVDTVVHDVVPDQTVAAGRYTSGLSIKPDRALAPAKNEWSRPGALRNVAGTVALVSEPGDPDSARGRFVVNLADQPRSDEAKYTVVGRVVEGLDVLRNVSRAPVEKKGGLVRLPRTAVKVTGAVVE
jgi:cyclophilin family peptidyl-prolyl cis-trans isomerase/predicted Ser/Thr protein kinase